MAAIASSIQSKCRMAVPSLKAKARRKKAGSRLQVSVLNSQFSILSFQFSVLNPRSQLDPIPSRLHAPLLLEFLFYFSFFFTEAVIMSRVQRAILSVTDKSGLVDFARKLSGLGVELVSTGGTARLLRDSGITVKDISDLTGFPEMLDGRVKTLHPKVHGGILHRRADAAHRAAVAEHGIEPIDMVVVNLYAFEKTASKQGVHFDELIENIDIGGPSMIRSAAKNFHDVAVVTSPSDYEAIAEEMGRSGGALSKETKWRLGKKAFC